MNLARMSVCAALGLAAATTAWSDEFSQEDLRRWEAQFQDVVKQERALGTSPELGTNGVACAQLGPYETNSYILTCPITGDSLLVDAPAEASGILKALKNTHPRYILITHNHMDHIGALSELKFKLRVPIGVHRLDAKGLPLQENMILEDGGKVDCGYMSVKILHTPGHTPGSLSFLIGRYLIAGDTIFPGGPGKTRSPEKISKRSISPQRSRGTGRLVSSGHRSSQRMG